ncbi:origin of replication complex subunit 1-like isoform X1 [Zingiber officinale]|uniref:origin of replication complex subunit 1-like isoform X1 n=1 Tax=Zingiber officinale TaxID=94328 RepID=UPI001C4DCA9F|nr:origin of replication complex subunit 1-like isoform X1 [Zingiber officinale]XP_042377519.1 origin of replication complex subunit 1-like isoform X1 [Zingiber officinale]XP_042377520.1 origin of replication complex subunit 1-like isoform X1 [Zingiber officinale]
MAAKRQTRGSKSSPAIPLTPESTVPPRRSLRSATATTSDPTTPVVPTSVADRTPKSVSKRSLSHPDAPFVTPDRQMQRRSGTPLRTTQKGDASGLSPITPDSKQRRRPGPSVANRTPKSASKRSLSRPDAPIVTPDQKKQRRSGTPSRTPQKRDVSGLPPVTPDFKHSRTARRRVYYKKVVFDEVEFEVGDDVYLKRREGLESDDDDLEVEECRICFREGGTVMIECDDCLGGFHLKCLKPPLRKIPEGDWICDFCEARKLGKDVQLPSPPKGKKVRRTAKEKLLSCDLWAARIESLWREPDGTYWLKCRWYIIPEETAVGRQPHNLRRELYRTNNCNDIEMECVIRHCYAMNPKAYSEAKDAGDDVFYCEYEYDIHWHNFKRITDIDDANENDNGVESDEEWVYKDSDAEEDLENEGLMKSPSCQRKHEVAANICKGRTFGLQKIGIKTIPEHTRCRKQTDLEKAKGMLLLASLPKFLPCRTKEMEEITAFIRGAISGEHCLGRCLYIHGVPGTGKTMSVLSVMRNLRSEVDAGTLRPYTFVEINGLKLASPENIYKVIHEALSGHRAGWKKALHFLNERFNNGTRAEINEHRPCVLLIDELDLLLTRNQSVLYNILDWPTKPHANLIVIGIANTMDLPEKLLPRISSRMGIQRLCFGPYTYQQLQEIISSRLNSLDAFEDQAIEFASRKVAAMSGDARRALEICRRAAEIADYQLKQSLLSKQSLGSRDDLMEEKQRVRMTHIQAALEEVFQAPHIQVMKTSSRLSKIFLVAMVRELYRTGLGETNFEKLATTVISMCSSNREAPPGWDTLMKVGCKLGESRIILCEEGTKHRLQKLQLNFPSDDVSFALKDCSELPWLAKYL